FELLDKQPGAGAHALRNIAPPHGRRLLVDTVLDAWRLELDAVPRTQLASRLLGPHHVRLWRQNQANPQRTFDPSNNHGDDPGDRRRGCAFRWLADLPAATPQPGTRYSRRRPYDCRFLRRRLQ